MRLDLLEAVPKFLRLPRNQDDEIKNSSKYSRIGIAKDVMKHPRNGIPRDMTQAISWLEDFFNRYTVAMTVK
eukprot:3298129-Amphidinium_carterae.1